MVVMVQQGGSNYYDILHTLWHPWNSNPKVQQMSTVALRWAGEGSFMLRHSCVAILCHPLML